MQSPKVSVLMPIYNAEKYIEESVLSILSQSFTDFEMLLINDGSTDNSDLMLQKLRERDKRIRLFDQTNVGLVPSLNRGVEYARASFIARMDADDVAFPQRFEKQLRFLESHPDHVAVGSQVLLIDSEGLPICPFSKCIEHEEIDRSHLAGKGGAMCHPAVMIRREALEKIGGYRSEMKHAEDIDLFLRLGEIGKLANLPEILLKYRMHPKSVGHSYRKEQRLSAEKAVIEAHIRRGIAPPKNLNCGGEHQTSISDLHRKWAWWALKAGNVATARKHAFLALKKSPLSTPNWRVMACAMRGY